MGKKFSVWLDSGANCQSMYKQTVSLDDLGIEDEEWDAMTDAQKDEVMREVAFTKGEWGYAEIDG